jgi:uncharacterized protein DUF1579
MSRWSYLALGALSLLAVSASVAQSPEKRRVVDPRDVLALEAGTWDAVITSPAHKPGEKQFEAKGVQVNELRSGGKWMLNRMSVNGGAYEGTGIWGYDEKTGRYSGAWVDNGTAVIRMDSGSWDPDTNIMTWTAEIERPDGGKLRMRATSAFAGNVRTYRSFAVTDAGDIPLSTVVFTRRPR